MEAFFGFLKVTVICVSALIALLLILAMLPKSPVRDLLLAIGQRFGMMAAVTVVGVPVQDIPVFDLLYDVAALAGVGYYWCSLFRDQHKPEATRPRLPSREDHDPR